MNITKKAATVLYGLPDAGDLTVLGSEDKLYNTDIGLQIELEADGILDADNDMGLETAPIAVEVLLVTSDYDFAVAHDAGDNVARVLATASVTATWNAGLSYGVVDETVTFDAQAASAALKSAAGVMIVMIGADSAGIDELGDGAGAFGAFALNGGLALPEFHIMPGSQYPADFQATKDTPNRITRMDTIQIKSPEARRQLAPRSHVTSQGADSVQYLDEILDTMAGELARIKDIRNENGWDGDPLWSVDSHMAAGETKGRFNIDTGLSLQLAEKMYATEIDTTADINAGADVNVTGIIHALADLDLAASMTDAISGVVVEFSTTVEDGAAGARSWKQAYNGGEVAADEAIRAHLNLISSQVEEIYTAPEVHPTDAPEGSVAAWLLSKIDPAHGLDASGYLRRSDDGVAIVINGTGSEDVDAQMVIPGLLSELSHTGDGSVDAYTADAAGVAQELQDGAVSFATPMFLKEVETVRHEVDGAPGTGKIEGVKLSFGHDSLARMLDMFPNSVVDIAGDNNYYLSLTDALAEAMAGEDYISNMVLDGSNLSITRHGQSAFAGNVDLSSLPANLAASVMDDLSDVSDGSASDGNVLTFNANVLASVNVDLGEVVAGAASGLGLTFTAVAPLRTGAGGNDLSVQFIEDLGEPLSAAMNVDVLEIKFDATAASVDMEEIRAYITDPANNLDDDITCALLGGTAGTELAPAELFAYTGGIHSLADGEDRGWFPGVSAADGYLNTAVFGADGASEVKSSITVTIGGDVVTITAGEDYAGKHGDELELEFLDGSPVGLGFDAAFAGDKISVTYDHTDAGAPGDGIVDDTDATLVNLYAALDALAQPGQDGEDKFTVAQTDNGSALAGLLPVDSDPLEGHLSGGVNDWEATLTKDDASTMVLDFNALAIKSGALVGTDLQLTMNDDSILPDIDLSGLLVAGTSYHDVVEYRNNSTRASYEETIGGSVIRFIAGPNHAGTAGNSLSIDWDASADADPHVTFNAGLSLLECEFVGDTTTVNDFLAAHADDSDIMIELISGDGTDAMPLALQTNGGGSGVNALAGGVAAGVGNGELLEAGREISFGAELVHNGTLAFKDKMNVYVNGLRIAKDEFAISTYPSDAAKSRLTFVFAVEAGEVIVIDVNEDPS